MMIGNICDAVLLLVIAVIVIIYAKRGVTVLFKPARFYGAIYFGWVLRRSVLAQNVIVSRIINKDGFRASIFERVDSRYGDKLENAAQAVIQNENERFDGIFGFLEKLFSDLRQYCLDNFSGEAEDFTEKIVDFLTDKILGFICGAIGFAVMFVICFIIFWIASVILKALFKKGVFRVLDVTLGAFIGMILAFIIAWVISFAMVRFSDVISPGDPEAVKSGIIGVVRWFYYDSPLSVLFGIK